MYLLSALCLREPPWGDFFFLFFAVQVIYFLKLVFKTGLCDGASVTK